MLRKLYSVLLLLFVFTTLSYSQQTSTDDYTKAIAVIQSLQQDGKISGTVTFTKLADAQMQVVADIKGLTPGKHGFHIHQYGDISSKDGKSAGDHFNPTNKPHAGPGDAMHHSGDMGNITAQTDGTAHLDMKINGEINSIIGRSVIIHEKEDDLMSQPAGNAGARIAAGVIGIANAK
ncbi:MAG: superoxide dismutase family protein [Bacillota bacterium]